MLFEFAMVGVVLIVAGVILVNRKVIAAGIRRLLTLLLGLTIVAVVGWYVARLLLSARIVIFVRPGDPLYNLICGGTIIALLAGITFVHSALTRGD
jgi:hypothetical protein